MSLTEFETLFDRTGTSQPTEMGFVGVADVGLSGDTGTTAGEGCVVVPEAETVTGVSTTLRAVAASTVLPEASGYRAIAFGPPGTIASGIERLRPLREAVAGCYGCGAELRVAAVGYSDMVRLVEATGGHYIARPVERVWCPACPGNHIEAGGPGLVGAGAGIAPQGPAAHDAGGSARPGLASTVWGRPGGSARGTEVARCV